MTLKLQLNQLTIAREGKPLVADLELTMQSGECWAILGPNGAGKTTLLLTLCGLLKPLQGEIIVHNIPLEKLSLTERAWLFGLLFQENTFSFPEKVADLLQLTLEQVRACQTQISAPIKKIMTQDSQLLPDLEKILAAFELQHYAQNSITSLSFGEQRRVAAAMLFAQYPQIYLLDEPTNHLDFKYQHRLLEHFRPKNHKITIISTHDFALIERFCTHALILLPNQNWYAGRKDEVMSTKILTMAFDEPLEVLKTHAGKFWYRPNY